MEKEVYFVSAKKYTIDEFEIILAVARQKGAEYFKHEGSGDRMWPFEWIRFYRKVSDEEIKQERISKIQSELKELTNDK